MRLLLVQPWELCSWGGSPVMSGLRRVVVMIFCRWRIQHVNIHAFDVGPMGLLLVQPWELCSWGGSPMVSGLPTTPKVVVMILGRWRIQHVNIHAFDVGPMGLLLVQPTGDPPQEQSSHG